MPLYAYRLVGRASSVPIDYIPSLIGVGRNQIDPLPTDQFFTSYDLPADAFDHITIIESTEMVSYDSAAGIERDPIVTVKTAEGGFYHTVSELAALLIETGNTTALDLLRNRR